MADPRSPEKTLVVYTADAGYAFPTLVSARSIRQHAKDNSFDIWMFAVDYPADVLESVREIAAAFNITVVPMSSSEYLKFDVSGYRTAKDFEHLSPSVLARLVTGQHIPEKYEQVLYVDGDTLCVGDMSELAAFNVPADTMLGVEDALNYWKRDNGGYGAECRRYLDSIGLGIDHTFYNTGVLLARRETWRDVGAEALRFFITNTELCIYPVDSSMNVAAKGKWKSISARWNFMAPFRMWDLDAAISPRFYHFTGKEKPWRGDLKPWQDFWPRFEAFAAEPTLTPFAPKPASPGVCAESNRHIQMWRLKSATVHRPRSGRARAGVMAGEKNVLI